MITSQGTVSFRCPFTTSCMNHRCIWKQYDCHGRNPWWIPDKELQAEQNKILENLCSKYGEPYFPQWKVMTGTNILHAYCLDYIHMTEIDTGEK